MAGLPCTKDFCLTVDPLCTGSVTDPANLVWTVVNAPGNAIPQGTATGSAAGASGSFNDQQPPITAGTQFPVSNFSAQFCSPLGANLTVNFSVDVVSAGGLQVNGNFVFGGNNTGHFTPSITVAIPAGISTISVIAGSGTAPGQGPGDISGTFTLSIV